MKIFKTRLAASTLASAALFGSFITAPPAVAQESTLSSDDYVYNSSGEAIKGSLGMGSAQGLAGSSIPNDPAAFYDGITRDAEGAPGEILKSQPGVLALGLPRVDLSAGKTTTVAYISRDSHDNPIPVTGSVTESTIPWTGPGPRPTIIMVPGTQGNRDQCAPSRLQTNGIEYETLPTVAALAKGYNIVMTDLPGLGVPNYEHTYMNLVDQAHATLDMARAAKNLGLETITDESPLATFGYSQGGGGSAAALELAPTYAPELNIKAGYAGGIPADLGMTAEQIDGGMLVGALGYTIAGAIESEPELQSLLTEKLNDRGLELLKQTSDECIWDSLIRHAGMQSHDLTKGGETIGEILSDGRIKEFIDRQLIGDLPPKVPVYVGHGTNDDTVPVEGSRIMAAKWCRAGTPVYYNEHLLPKVAPLADHALPMFTNLSPALTWLDLIFRGKDFPTTDCSQIPAP